MNTLQPRPPSVNSQLLSPAICALTSLVPDSECEALVSEAQLSLSRVFCGGLHYELSQGWLLTVPSYLSDMLLVYLDRCSMPSVLKHHPYGLTVAVLRPGNCLYSSAPSRFWESVTIDSLVKQACRRDLQAAIPCHCDLHLQVPRQHLLGVYA